MLRMTILGLFIQLTLATTLCARTNEEAFNNIYINKGWGTNEKGEGHSGSGSTLANTKVYRAFLQDFLKTNNIKSVVDIGCGDWEFSKKINWAGINYTGYDVVQSVIRKNRKRFGSPSIKFVHADAVFLNIPKADLLICKDVLQHLPNADIQVMIGQLHKFKHCLITNDVHPIHLTSHNHDINRGGYHFVDLANEPFKLPTETLLIFKSLDNMKKVLHLENR